MKVCGCSFFFAEKKKEPKKNLSAASDSVKVSGLAWSVLPEPANAEFLGYLRFEGLFFPP
jgi:hypothetical protein